MIHESVDKAKTEASQQEQRKRQMEEQDRVIKENLSKIKNKLVVLSGKGGVGKSSVAANLAVSFAKKGYKTGLMDVDLHGPSIAHMMGMTELLNVSQSQLLIPEKVMENLSVVSIEALMHDKDQAVIWRGPAKTGMIKQFVSNVEWGELDFLIIDAPPGTGDEPISVVQTIPQAMGIIVTTPQEVALSDIRKSISFCKTVKLRIVGIVENMASFKCPHCNEPIELFKSGGGKRTAEKAGIEFLGSIPFDLNVVDSGDSGRPVLMEETDTDLFKSFGTVIDNITRQVEKYEKQA